jgi:hypothetical protein
VHAHQREPGREGKRGHQPQRRPLRSHSSTDLPAETGTPAVTGRFPLEPPQLDRGNAGSIAATITFDHNANSQFRSLYEWLLTVVETNKAQGIDPSTVEFETVPTLVEEQRKAEQERAEQEKKAQHEREQERTAEVARAAEVRTSLPSERLR